MNRYESVWNLKLIQIDSNLKPYSMMDEQNIFKNIRKKIEKIIYSILLNIAN